MAEVMKMDTPRHLSKGEIAKKKNDLYKSTFRDLEPGTVYWDPLGARARKSVNLKEKFFEADKERLEKFDELHRGKGYPLAEAVKEVSKNYDTGDWSLPAYYIPDVFVTNPERTPIADMIAREARDNETVTATEETDQGQSDIEFGLETTNDTESSYQYGDGAYTTHSYDMVGYGGATRLEDKLILAARTLRASEDVAERAKMTAMRQTEERQILQGTNNNASGFDGFDDLGTNYESISDPASFNEITKIRELIDEVELKGGNRDSTAVVTSFDVHRQLRNEEQDFVRYNDIGDELGFGFSTLEFDGVPIMKSHAIPANSSLSSGDSFMYAVDMRSNYMAMLQDVSVKPLAKTGPQEQFAVDAYGTLVSEAPSHIQYLDKA